MDEQRDTYTLAKTGLMRLENIYRTPAGQEHVRQVLDLIPFQPGWKVLDLGCGTGHFARQLARRVHPGEVIGVDNDPKVLELATSLTEQEQLTNVRFVCASATDLPFPPGEFDVIFMRLFLHHFREPEQLIQAAYRLLAPGGRLAANELEGFLSTWYPDAPVMVDFRGFQHHLKEKIGVDLFLGKKLRSLFLDNGFRHIAVSIVPEVYAGTPEPARVDNVRILMENWKDLLAEYLGPDAVEPFSHRLLAYLEREDTLLYHDVFLVQGVRE